MLLEKSMDTDATNSKSSEVVPEALEESDGVARAAGICVCLLAGGVMYWQYSTVLATARSGRSSFEYNSLIIWSFPAVIAMGLCGVALGRKYVEWIEPVAGLTGRRKLVMALVCLCVVFCGTGLDAYVRAQIVALGFHERPPNASDTLFSVTRFARNR